MAVIVPNTIGTQESLLNKNTVAISKGKMKVLQLKAYKDMYNLRKLMLWNKIFNVFKGKIYIFHNKNENSKL